ncbi:MAG: cyclase family protein, partial [Acidimicrobiales bacterium]
MDKTTEGSEPTVSNEAPRRGRRLKGLTGVFLAFAMLSAAGIAGAMAGFQVRGAGHSNAILRCGGGMTRLGHVLSEDSSIFPGDPSPEITIDFTIAEDFFLLETIKTGTHTGTHFDAPGHFIEGGRTVDELDATEFVWPAYVIDVRDRIESEGADFQLTKTDIRRYERENGRIKKRSLVIIYTGWDELFGTDAYLEDAPGFSGDAVQWMFDRRGINGL